jgi:hypothetical protein
MKLQNKPGEPVVTREQGARFYCLNCDGAYSADTNKGFVKANIAPLCKCRVYVSADTLKLEIRYTSARREPSKKHFQKSHYPYNKYKQRIPSMTYKIT